ncbi:L-threonine 3-dehydrogenase [Bacilliculturomica massiliensis]|uniref:L-threonine 3-dehydrogenase n=1 Tax=Bacilliculturomica massiliensis TaxID=1917867 RepID=UPI001031629D|nr:L-threonine 3-dehydrogenase [Bacilliculturomica massiliensis]
MDGKMKALVKYDAAPGCVRIEEVDIPKPGKNEILVKITAASICGSDYHVYSWDVWSQQRVKPPVIMGHEFAGEIVEVGEEVRAFQVGDHVSSETHFVCGRCDQCKTGNGHICENTVILGINVNGAFAEYAVIPEASAWLNDRNVDPALLAIQEPLGNAVHTLMAGEVTGKTVAVVGCGPIGILGVAVARAMSPARLIAVEPNAYRGSLARRLGAHVVIDPSKEDTISRIMEETDGKGVEVVAEMSGNVSATQQAFKYIRPGGRISLLGLSSKEVTLDLDNDVIGKGITIKGITGRRLFETWYAAKGLLQSGGLDLAPAVTHRFAMEDFQQAFELMKEGNSGKIVLYPDVTMMREEQL